MKEISKDIYIKELEVVKQAKSVILESDSKEEMLAELEKVTGSFEKFINETAKITRITDMLQNKLQKSHAQIEEQQLELQKLNKDLRDANIIKDKFFSIIAHDLRGPVGNISVVIEELVDKENAYSEKDKMEVMEMLGKSARNTLNLLENLLQWARMQKNEIKFEVQKVNLDEIIETAVSTIEQIALKKKISILVENNSNLEILADKNMLITVIRNIISNSIKFTNPEGQIVLKYSNNNEKIYISIRDNGVGMSSEKVNKLFKINEHVSQKGTLGEKGTGLGLILCKEFMEKHNGKISCISEIGKGTEFLLELPVIIK